MVPITEQLVDGYVALIKELNWNRVALLSYDDEFNIDVCVSLTSLFVNKNVKSVAKDVIFNPTLHDSGYK